MKLRTKIVFVFLLLFVFVSFNLDRFDLSDVTGRVVSKDVQVFNENTTEVQVYFCQTDDCEENMIKWISIAEESVHCALFDLGLDEIKDALVLMSDSVDVKLFVDDHYLDKVSDTGFARNDSSSQLSHNKFCVIDGYIVWTGSFNPTVRGNSYNDNNAVVVVSEYIGRNYEDEFSELWSGVYGKGDRVKYPSVVLDNKTVKNYFCPEDWCTDKIVKEITMAEESVKFMAFSFTSGEIARALIAAHDRGINVVGVMEKQQRSKYSKFDMLNASGVDVKWDTNKYKMHHKVFIIDDKVVVTGSMNPTGSGDKRNDENVLIFYDERIAGEFVKEWERVSG